MVRRGVRRHSADLLERHRRRAIDRFAEMAAGALADAAPSPPSEDEAHVVGVALVGAMTELLVHRMARGHGPSDRMVVDQLVRVFRRSLDR